MGQLAEHGYTLVNDMDNADICVVNSCTVKNPSESRGLHLATWPSGWVPGVQAAVLGGLGFCPKDLIVVKYNRQLNPPPQGVKNTKIMTFFVSQNWVIGMETIVRKESLLKNWLGTSLRLQIATMCQRSEHQNLRQTAAYGTFFLRNNGAYQS